MSGLPEAVASMSFGAMGIWLFGSILVSGQVLKWVGEWRAVRKLTVDERQANREGFTAQVDLLTRHLRASDAENRRTRTEIAALRTEYDQYRRDCHAETEQLRQQIIQLELDLAALHRKEAAAAIAAVHDLSPDYAPHGAAAAARTAAIIERDAATGD